MPAYFGSTTLQTSDLQERVRKQLRSGNLDPVHLGWFLDLTTEMRADLFALILTARIDVERMCAETNNLFLQSHILYAFSRPGPGAVEADEEARRLFEGKSAFEAMEFYGQRTYLMGGPQELAAIRYIARQFFSKQ